MTCCPKVTRFHSLTLLFQLQFFPLRFPQLLLNQILMFLVKSCRNLEKVNASYWLLFSLSVFFFVITLVYNFLRQCIEKCTWTGLAAFAGKMFLNKLCYSFKVKILWQRRSFKKWNKNLKRKFKCSSVGIRTGTVQR